MIFIDKGSCPVGLSRSNMQRTQELEIEFLRDKSSYLSGTQTFKFSSLYKCKSVLKQLKLKQHNKCCFSEAKFNGDYPHVEHFRPKGGVENNKNGAFTYPGYYWLAYNWDNLLLCKSVINCSYKRNFFPLKVERLRNRIHTDTNTETALLIDPSKENPRRHIRFYGYSPIAKTKRGEFNINMLGLRHSDFVEGRKQKYILLKGLKESVDLLLASGYNPSDSDIQPFIAELKAAMEPEAEFSSMAIDFLSALPHLK